MRLFARGLAISLSFALPFLAPARADDQGGERPDDETMTCQQIGMELPPYAQQMGVTWRPVGNITQTLVKTQQSEMARDLPRLMAMSAAADTAATASAMGVPGVRPAAAAAMEAEQQRMTAENAAEQKPIADRLNGQLKPAIAQGQALQRDARLQQLLKLAKEKNCH
jgi:hypothetical protein